MSHIILISIAVIVFLFLLVLIVRKLKKRVARANHYPENKQLYVGNLPYQVNVHHLREHFSRYGELQTVRLIKNTRTGRSKGFAFIAFANIKDAKNALTENGQDMRGRAIVVRMAKPRDSE